MGSINTTICLKKKNKDKKNIKKNYREVKNP